jgi:hypothetical protein
MLASFSLWISVRDCAILFSKGPSWRVLDPSKHYKKVVKIRKLQVRGVLDRSKNKYIVFFKSGRFNVWIFQIQKDNAEVNHIGPFLKGPISLFSPAAAILCWGWGIWPICTKSTKTEQGFDQINIHYILPFMLNLKIWKSVGQRLERKKNIIEKKVSFDWFNDIICNQTYNLTDSKIWLWSKLSTILPHLPKIMNPWKRWHKYNHFAWLF